LLNNLATALFEHKKILTTEAKAKNLDPLLNSSLQEAKHAYHNENAKQLPDGQTIDIHNRRIVSRYIKEKLFFRSFSMLLLR
jgi:ribosomal protein L17